MSSSNTQGVVVWPVLDLLPTIRLPTFSFLRRRRGSQEKVTSEKKEPLFTMIPETPKPLKATDIWGSEPLRQPIPAIDSDFVLLKGVAEEWKKNGGYRENLIPNDRGGVSTSTVTTEVPNTTSEQVAQSGVSPSETTKVEPVPNNKNKKRNVRRPQQSQPGNNLPISMGGLIVVTAMIISVITLVVLNITSGGDVEIREASRVATQPATPRASEERFELPLREWFTYRKVQSDADWLTEGDGCIAVSVDNGKINLVCTYPEQEPSYWPFEQRMPKPVLHFSKRGSVYMFMALDEPDVLIINRK